MRASKKIAKRLAARQAAFDEHGSNPNMGQNPSNGNGTGHDMKRPGSLNPRKR